LERAGLIVRTRQAREHQISLKPIPIEEAQGWIGHYGRFWKQEFDAVGSPSRTAGPAGLRGRG
jgi:hypothetical protein